MKSRLWKSLALLLGMVFIALRGSELQADEVSGAYYDWKPTRQPERPYLHRYDQTLVMKLFLAEKQANEGCKVYLTFEQALDVIKRLDTITLGLPKIVYLVGWQHNGHDSKYPDWSVVNSRLKRAQDPDAVASLKWLMAEGFKYHTTVSLHINMMDAYQDSPLWETYLKNDIIAKHTDGKLITGGRWGGQDSYYISYAKEWETGYAQKRIDDLLALLPIQKVGTIHIDAFHTHRPQGGGQVPGASDSQNKINQSISPYLNLSIDREVEAQRKIYRYFRDKGVDLTSEECTGFRLDPFCGLQPMAWHYRPFDRTIPPSLYCGTPMTAEEEIKRDPVNLPGLIAQFCQKVVPWYDRNQAVDGLSAQIVAEGGDLLAPALWRPKTLVAYSEKGCPAKTWPLPSDWKGVAKVTVSEIKVTGLEKRGEIAVQKDGLPLSLSPRQAVVITP